MTHRSTEASAGEETMSTRFDNLTLSEQLAALKVVRHRLVRVNHFIALRQTMSPGMKAMLGLPDNLQRNLVHLNLLNLLEMEEAALVKLIETPPSPLKPWCERFPNYSTKLPGHIWSTGDEPMHCIHCGAPWLWWDAIQTALVSCG